MRREIGDKVKKRRQLSKKKTFFQRFRGDGGVTANWPSIWLQWAAVFIFSSTFKKENLKTAAVVCTKTTVGNEKYTELKRNVPFLKQKEKTLIPV